MNKVYIASLVTSIAWLLDGCDTNALLGVTALWVAIWSACGLLALLKRKGTDGGNAHTHADNS